MGKDHQRNEIKPSIVNQLIMIVLYEVTCAKYDANCISVKRAVTISPAPEQENCRILAKFRGNLVKLECFSEILISEIMEKAACN